MMVIFLLVIILGRVALQFILVGDSGVRSGTKLKTKREMLISFLMFGVLVVQAILAWLYSVSRLEPHIELGVISKLRHVRSRL